MELLLPRHKSLLLSCHWLWDPGQARHHHSRWLCSCSRRHVYSLPLFPGDLPHPSTLPSPRLLPTQVILLAMKPQGLAASSGQGFSQSYLEPCRAGSSQLGWREGDGESQDMRPEPS